MFTTTFNFILLLYNCSLLVPDLWFYVTSHVQGRWRDTSYITKGKALVIYTWNAIRVIQQNSIRSNISNHDLAPSLCSGDVPSLQYWHHVTLHRQYGGSQLLWVLCCHAQEWWWGFSHGEYQMFSNRWWILFPIPIIIIDIDTVELLEQSIAQLEQSIAPLILLPVSLPVPPQ